MKKAFVLFVVLVFVLFAFAACGSSTTESNDDLLLLLPATMQGTVKTPFEGTWALNDDPTDRQFIFSGKTFILQMNLVDIFKAKFSYTSDKIFFTVTKVYSGMFDHVGDTHTIDYVFSAPDTIDIIIDGSGTAAPIVKQP